VIVQNILLLNLARFMHVFFLVRMNIACKSLTKEKVASTGVKRQ